MTHDWKVGDYLLLHERQLYQINALGGGWQDVMCKIIKLKDNTIYFDIKSYIDRHATYVSPEEVTQILLEQ